MNNKRKLRLTLMVLLVACFLFAYPTVAHAASAGTEAGSSVSNFFTGILDCLVMICEGIIGIFAALIQLIVDFVKWIISLFS